MKERKGDYLGKTVQVIPFWHVLLELYAHMVEYEMLTVINIQVVPHVTDEIKQWIQSVSSVAVDGQTRSADVCVIELGGTVGRVL